MMGQNPAIPPDPPPIPTSKITANKDLEDLNLHLRPAKTPETRMKFNIKSLSILPLTIQISCKLFNQLWSRLQMNHCGKFIKGKPTMEELRKLFIGQFQLLGTVKIAFYDYRCVYLDFTNEVDFKHIYFKPFIDIGPYTMKVMKWTPDFKPESKKHLVPVWILIHKLPWHLFRWDILSKLVQSIGIAVARDQATFPNLGKCSQNQS
ncbi:hypothetical protein H5410_043770 [Solanum commersonii]|uniref:DUF4283 domain-containing protein n=1 Tax=Solanum commersonii TaxID=4109 RepID=A0A9J5Y154_SOLCO|nr:hypothetical protein H5410_043770 [Solanum commersonii]